MQCNPFSDIKSCWATLFSLTVAAKSKDAARRTAANKILHKIREHSDNLVNQVGNSHSPKYGVFEQLSGKEDYENLVQGGAFDRIACLG